MSRKRFMKLLGPTDKRNVQADIKYPDICLVPYPLTWTPKWKIDWIDSNSVRQYSFKFWGRQLKSF